MAPYEELKSFVTHYINENRLEESLANKIPKKWEKYGDFVLFDERTLPRELWKNGSESFWENVAGILKCKRIGIKSKIRNDGFRSPNVTILLGNDPWTLHRDNSIWYSWNVLENMFSAGNASERHRIARLNCENEVVVDLFAGIGYFTLPFLIHGRAKFVHACEWNPVACEALKRNLDLNKLTGKCEIHQGDNRTVCPKGIGNRVNLGLLPSSEGHWKTACEALVNVGGILHVHETVEITKSSSDCDRCTNLASQIKLDTWCKSIVFSNGGSALQEGKSSINWRHEEWLRKALHVLHSIMAIMLDLNGTKKWTVSVENLNFVKSYAPKVHHLVYDVKVASISDHLPPLP